MLNRKKNRCKGVYRLVEGRLWGDDGEREL